jgi:uncharacterized protein YbjQ (UPF0145 family)
VRPVWQRENGEFPENTFLHSMSTQAPVAFHHSGEVTPSKAMFITTTFTIEGYRITEYKGLVRGIIVRAPTIAQGIVGGLKNIIGGRIGAYTEMCEQARLQAYDSMLQHAQALGANAILGVRYDASEVVSKGSATEVLCYGTAVVIQQL